MLNLLAQVVRDNRPWFDGGFSSWGIAEICAAIVIAAGCIGIVMVCLRYFGITVPEWLRTIVLIVIVCIVALAAIRFISRM